MVFTTVAYYESQAANGLTFVAALADQHITVSGDDITVPAQNKIMGVYAMGTNIQACRILSPSLRRMWNLDVHEIMTGAALPETALGYCDMHANPLPLVISEKMNCQIDNANNAEAQHIIVFLTDGSIGARSGEIFTIKATSATAAVANTWTNVALVFGQTLPAGRYAVVGMSAKSASAVAARLVFVGGSWRPGCLGQLTYEADRPSIFRNGGLGTWGEFEFDQPPTADILCTAADATQEFFFDLIQIRAGR